MIGLTINFAPVLLTFKVICVSSPTIAVWKFPDLLNPNKTSGYMVNPTHFAVLAAVSGLFVFSVAKFYGNNVISPILTSSVSILGTFKVSVLGLYNKAFALFTVLVTDSESVLYAKIIG